MPGRRDRATVRVRAFAKINLTLRVLGLRPDGFHDLRTTFQSIALHDTLTCRARPGDFRIVCNDPACPSGESNLVWQAAERVWAAGGRRGAPRDVEVRLVKRIPMEAGLAGGSSDAAAAVRAFAALWRVDLNGGRAHEIASALGADVPFFLEGGTALGVERGDVVYPLIDAPRMSVVVVVPSFGVSTREAFGWWDAAGAAQRPRARGISERAEVRPRDQKAPAAMPAGASAQRDAHARHQRAAALSQERRGWAGAVREVGPREKARNDDRDVWIRLLLEGNDLEAPVAAHHPEIARLVTALRRRGASYAAMSGSGSAVFGLFDRRAPASAAATSLDRRGRRVLVTRTLDRAKYQRLARLAR